jgi:hypothetical protein
VWLCAIALAVTLSPSATATQWATHWGAQLGTMQTKDEALRPLEWAGPSALLIGGIRNSSTEAIYLADLSLGGAYVTNRFSHAGMVIEYGTHLAAEYVVARRRLATLFVGVAHRFETLNAYYADWDDSFMWWHTAHTLAPRVSFVRMRRERIESELNIEIPILGLLSRCFTSRSNAPATGTRTPPPEWGWTLKRSTMPTR